MVDKNGVPSPKQFENSARQLPRGFKAWKYSSVPLGFLSDYPSLCSLSHSLDSLFKTPKSKT